MPIEVHNPAIMQGAFFSGGVSNGVVFLDENKKMTTSSLFTYNPNSGATFEINGGDMFISVDTGDLHLQTLGQDIYIDSAGTVTVTANSDMTITSSSGNTNIHNVNGEINIVPTVGNTHVHKGDYYAVDDSVGISTTITTASLVGKTITVKNGIITGFA